MFEVLLFIGTLVQKCESVAKCKYVTDCCLFKYELSNAKVTAGVTAGVTDELLVQVHIYKVI